MDLKPLEMIDDWLYGEEQSMPILDTSTYVRDTPFLESEIAEVVPLSFQATGSQNLQWNSPLLESLPSEYTNLIQFPQDIDPLLDGFNVNPSNYGFEENMASTHHDMSFHGQGNGGLLEDVCNVKPFQETLVLQGQSNRCIVVKEEEMDEVGVGIRSGGLGKKHKTSSIGYKEIARHFYMNIADAAKELNVGLTVLKKRCRELGISRWPHRKMKSLQLLIRNVEEMGKGSVDEGLRKEMEELMEQRRQIEVKPHLELSDRTKRLRQACFKANYKRRRAMKEPRRKSDSHL